MMAEEIPPLYAPEKSRRGPVPKDYATYQFFGPDRT